MTVRSYKQTRDTNGLGQAPLRAVARQVCRADRSPQTGAPLDPPYILRDART